MNRSINVVLDYAYRHESDAALKERILPVRRFRVDGKNVEDVAKNELHRSRAWAYKWLKRFNTNGLDGLKDQPRSGRPPEIPEKKILKIRRVLSDNPSGWQAKEVMNMIYKNTGVKYHEVHIYSLLHKWASVPRYHKRGLLMLHQRKRNSSSKKSTGDTRWHPARVHISSKG